MRSGTPFIADAKPEVTLQFFDISSAQVGVDYANFAAGGSSQRRLLFIHVKEEPYTGIGVIHLDNSDGGLNSVPLLGCLASIQWNYNGGTHSTDQPYFVVDSQFISIEGLLIVELKVVSFWELLQESRRINTGLDLTDPTTGSGAQWAATTPVKDIIEAIITSADGIIDQWGLGTLTTLVAEPAGAGAIQTYTPIFLTRLNDSDYELLRRLMQMSNSGLTFRNATGPTLNYLDPTIPGPYYEYENDGVEHPFFEAKPGNGIVIPNLIFVVDREPDYNKQQGAQYVGYAEDTVSQGIIGIQPKFFVDPTVSSDAEATLKAAAILVRAQAETLLGTFVVPMNCCQELYDEVRITDNRNGALQVVGRVGKIERTFKASANDYNTEIQDQRDQYICTITLGGLGGGSTRTESVIAGSNDIETTIMDFKARSLANPFIDSPQLNSQTLSQHYAPQLETRPGSAGNQAFTGAYVAIGGLSITTPIVPIASEARVTILVEMFGNPGVVGDTLVVDAFFDGVAYTMPIVLIAPVVGHLETIERTYIIPIPADGATHVIDARMIQTVGAGANGIYKPNSRITVELFSGANSRLF